MAHKRPQHEHIGFFGSSQTGKSTLLRRFARQSKRDVIIYDPTAAPVNFHDGWPPDRRQFWNIFSEDAKQVQMHEDIAGFAHDIHSSREADVYIDEAADFFSLQDKHNHKIITRGRHDGLRIFMASQRATSIAPTCRDQCSVIYLFRLSKKDMTEIVGDAGFTLSEIEHERPRAAGELWTIDKITGKVYNGFVDFWGNGPLEDA